ncbi:MAG: nucleotidyltransferase domain-containing protein [Deltaproteobacteria bacterium]|nr:nucleotidyltransferase domain-containing protein [Deltaproteobacteria bacterium]
MSGRNPQQILNELPFLYRLTDKAHELLHVERVVVFGSRARGDQSQNSDVDIAFFFPRAFESMWPEFCAEVDENIPTLLHLDLVNTNKISTDFLHRILKEGLEIYAKSR